MKEFKSLERKKFLIRDYQPWALIQREMEVKGMWITVNIEKP